MPTIDTVIRWTLRTHSGRIALFAALAWLGLHFLAELLAEGNNQE